MTTAKQLVAQKAFKKLVREHLQEGVTGFQILSSEFWRVERKLEWQDWNTFCEFLGMGPALADYLDRRSINVDDWTSGPKLPQSFET
jgi:hypothetical protein